MKMKKYTPPIINVIIIEQECSIANSSPGRMQIEVENTGAFSWQDESLYDGTITEQPTVLPL